MKQEFDFEEAVAQLIDHLDTRNFKFWSPSRVAEFHEKVKHLIYATEEFVFEYDYAEGTEVADIIDTFTEKIDRFENEISLLKTKLAFAKAEASKAKTLPTATIEKVAEDWQSSWHFAEPADPPEDGWYNSSIDDEGPFKVFYEPEEVQWSSSQRFCSARRGK